VAGKISTCSEFWRNQLDASPFVLNIVDNGYYLPLKSEPPPFRARNNASSLRHRDFVEESINKLLKNNCIGETCEVPYVCNPSTVAEGSKLRLVLDLKHVNEYLNVQKFKYENLSAVVKLFEKDYYFGTFDLKDGYFHIPIAKEHYRYLGFSWTFKDGTTKYYYYKVLPFGLASACYAFTKVMRPLVKRWRNLGIRCAIYLDDGIFGDSDFKNCSNISENIQKDLNSAGLTINSKKSILTPSKTGKWLGFLIDTEKESFSVPVEKVLKLKTLICLTLSKNFATAREISKIAGTIISMGIAIGPASRLFTRNFYKFVDDQELWDKKSILNEEVINELKFWKDNFDNFNGFRIKPNHLTTKVIYSDASNSGYGGYILQRLGNIVSKGNFTEKQREKSSTYRELLAVRNILESFKEILANEAVIWHSDNYNVSRIIEVGSSKTDLQNLSIKIFETCVRNNIILQPSWIPREFNDIADSISKHKDTDNWSIDNETFEFIESHYQSFTVDRFSDDLNAKVKNFNSEFHCPGTQGVNTFTENWENDFNWVCPPISLIAEALKHFSLCKAKGVLFVPEWRSSYFWPLLTPNGRLFYEFVKDYIYLDPYFINNSKVENSAFDGFAKFNSLALLVDFK